VSCVAGVAENNAIAFRGEHHVSGAEKECSGMKIRGSGTNGAEKKQWNAKRVRGERRERRKRRLSGNEARPLH